jgi:hypothetical protein
MGMGSSSQSAHLTSRTELSVLESTRILSLPLGSSLPVLMAPSKAPEQLPFFAQLNEPDLSEASDTDLSLSCSVGPETPSKSISKIPVPRLAIAAITASKCRNSRSTESPRQLPRTVPRRTRSRSTDSFAVAEATAPPTAPHSARSCVMDGFPPMTLTFKVQRSGSARGTPRKRPVGSTVPSQTPRTPGLQGASSQLTDHRPLRRASTAIRSPRLPARLPALLPRLDRIHTVA